MKRNPSSTTATLCTRLVVAALMPASLLGQEAPPPEAPPPPTDTSLLDLYLQGGTLMHFIALCSVGTIALAVFCALRINRRKLITPAIIPSINREMSDRNLPAAYALSQQNPNMMTNSLAAALIKADVNAAGFNRGEMERAANDVLLHQESKLVYWVNYLNVFATVAPMLGLLGTVTGMIAAFQELAAGRSEPADLAGGIGMAMVTTAGGLIVGIPAMFLYFHFKNNLHTITGDVAKTLNNFFDLLTGHVVLDTPVTAPAWEERPEAGTERTAEEQAAEPEVADENPA